MSSAVFFSERKPMHPFEAYLKQQNLEALTVSVIAEVRYVTVWNAARGELSLFDQS
jgi:hypothetical protein